MTDDTARAEWWAAKLYDDLAFAAPEAWILHITRRFEDALAARPSGLLREAILAALNELGVPDENYPAPVANAVDILRAALAATEPEP